MLTSRTVLRGGLRLLLRAGPVRGPHPADRELHHPQPRPGLRRAEQRPGVPGRPGAAEKPAVDPRLHAPLPGRVQHPVRRERAARAARRDQPDASATPAARARTCSCGASATCSTRSPASGPCRATARSTSRPAGCVDGVHWPASTRSAAAALPSYDALQVSATRRFRGGLHRRVPVPVLAQQGHDAGVERGRHHAEHVRLRHGVRHEPAGHPAHLQRVAGLPDSRPGRFWTGGWRVGGIVNARSGVPVNVTISRPGQRHGERRDGDEHPRRQQPRHAAPGPGARAWTRT